ncbi:hypothetical protein [Streptomyces sp. BK340]|uniref:hypothetical protein n=1 Tax=Streptomyces sp. BK340 TaxID=2572903 RepID=UPI0011A46CBC|nr:hypothetical protein [Streptomyces sp. BK340]TVZ84850.1 hypothetical protein FB157_120117 [Streptomyces sp. BK340]
MSLMRPRDPVSAALGTLWAAGHVAAITLLGIQVYDDTAGPQAAAAAPDTPLPCPDLPSELGDV